MFVVHAGMHKTGTTSVQAYFGRRAVDGVHYLDWRDPNHSDLAVLLFRPDPETYWVFEREGRSRAEMMSWRAEVEAGLRADLTRNSGKTHIISAEQLAVTPPEAVAALHDFFKPYAQAFKVIVYVRPAAAFMTSMAQQYIRTGTAELKLVWPEYRKAIEKFDAIFGAACVDVRLYNPPGSGGWDIVSDFCGAIGLGPPTEQVSRENVGMGAGHLAMLLDRRLRIGHGPRTPQDAHEDHAFLLDVLRHPSPPFALHPDLVAREMQRHEDDLAWIEARLGGVSMAVQPEPKPGTVLFASTEDAIAYADTFRKRVAPQPSWLARSRRFAGRVKRRLLG